MVTTALNVQRAQVKAARAWRAKQKVAQRIDNFSIRYLLGINGEVADEWIYSTHAWNDGWIEKPVGQWKRVNLNKIFIYNTNVGTNHGRSLLVIDRRRLDNAEAQA